MTIHAFNHPSVERARALMLQLKSIISAKLEISGELGTRHQAMDLLHAFATCDMGTEHRGYAGEGDILDAFVKAAYAGESVTLFSPQMRTARLKDVLLEQCVAAGLTCRLWAYPETPAGYRYREGGGEVILLFASPEQPEPSLFSTDGESIQVTAVEIRRMLDQSGGIENALCELEAYAKSDEGFRIGPDLSAWLERSPAQPSPGF